MQSQENPVREKKINHPPRKLRGKPAYNKVPGCSAALSSATPGLRPHGFWSRPGPSDWVSPALTFPVNFHSGLRQFVSTRPLGLAAGVHSGGLHPTPFSSSPIGPTPKPTSPSATLYASLPQVLSVKLISLPSNFMGNIFLGGGEKKRITEERKDAHRKENCQSKVNSIPCCPG